MKGLKKFGFEAFRAGQEHAVKRILAGKNLEDFLWGETTKITNETIVEENYCWIVKILGGSIFLDFVNAPYQWIYILEF